MPSPEKEEAVVEGPPTPSTETEEEEEEDEYEDLDLHGPERFLAFTDAVVAIALTLLILPLMENANDFLDDGEHRSVEDWFKENGERFAGFVLTFFIVALFWKSHDSTFRHVEKFNELMVWLNFVWMAGIVFMPVASLLVYLAPSEDVGQYGVYIGSLLLSRLASLGMIIVSRRDKRTWKGNGLGSLHVILNVVTLILMFVALILSLFTGAGFYGMLILVLAHPIAILIKKNRQRIMLNAPRSTIPVDQTVSSS